MEHARNISVADLDPDRMDDWGLDGWIRAIRSHHLDWLELYRDGDRPRPDGPDCPAAYDRIRREILAAMPADAEEEEEGVNSSPGFPGRNETAWQPSTSSTSPADTPSPGPPAKAGGGTELK